MYLTTSNADWQVILSLHKNIKVSTDAADENLKKTNSRDKM